ncbi:MAG: DNA topoisomerase, partial [Myxococcota bacterium]
FAEAIVARVDDLTVQRVERRPVTESPPQLFDLTTLQRTANRRYGFSAERTLQIAQALYEKYKLITYPRTSSRYLSSDQRSQIGPLIALFEAHPTFGPHAQRLKASPPTLNKRIIDDRKVTDHHAIIPTHRRSKAVLPPNEKKIFELIVRRFLAALHPPAKLENTNVLLTTQRCAPPTRQDRELILPTLPPPPDRFVARGQVVLDPGWHAVEPPPPRARPLPPVREGERRSAQLSIRAGKTTPPPLYTDATLLAAMETAGKRVDDEELREAMKECGLGTPATRASIIETLLKREYAQRDKKTLRPTLKGIQLIDHLSIDTLKSASMTGAWEARLTRIAAGTDAVGAFRADIDAFVHRMVTQMQTVSSASSASNGSQAEVTAAVSETVGRCPRCRATVAMTRSGAACTKCPFTVPKYFAGRALKTAEIRDLLARGRTGRLRGFRSKKKKKFAAALVLDDGDVRFDFAEPTVPKAPRTVDVTCPACQKQGLIGGRQAWGCLHWRDGCRFTVPYVVENKKLTERELIDLITKGKTRKASYGPGKGRLHLEGTTHVLRLDP